MEAADWLARHSLDDDAAFRPIYLEPQQLVMAPAAAPQPPAVAAPARSTRRRLK